jgi:hypothetical protein
MNGLFILRSYWIQSELLGVDSSELRRFQKGMTPEGHIRITSWKAEVKKIRQDVILLFFYLARQLSNFD